MFYRFTDKCTCEHSNLNYTLTLMLSSQSRDQNQKIYSVQLVHGSD